MWQAFAQAGMEALGRRHAAHFQEQSATRAFDRQVALDATKHQRAVADLRAAGLNPILSATQGMGSSASSVSAGSPPGGGSNVDFAGTSAKSAQAELYQAEIAKVTAETASAMALKSKYDAETLDIMQGVQGGLKTNLAGSYLASSTKAYQDVEQSKQEVKESVRRMEKMTSEMSELAARTKLHGSTVQVNNSTRSKLLEDIVMVQNSVKLSRLQQEQVQQAVNLLRNQEELSKSDVGKVTTIVKDLLPILEAMSRGDSPGLRYPSRFGR